MGILQNPILPDPSPFDWDGDFMVHFIDDKFSLWWAPIYIVDNIFTRILYLTSGMSNLYFTCGVFGGYHGWHD